MYRTNGKNDARSIGVSIVRRMLVYNLHYWFSEGQGSVWGNGRAAKPVLKSQRSWCRILTLTSYFDVWTAGTILTASILKICSFIYIVCISLKMFMSFSDKINLKRTDARLKKLKYDDFIKQFRDFLTIPSYMQKKKENVHLTVKVYIHIDDFLCELGFTFYS